MTRGDQAFLRRVLIALAIGAVALLLWQLAGLWLLVFASCLLAILFRAMAEPLSRLTRLPPRAALGVVVLGLLLLLGAASWMFGAQISAQFRLLGEVVPQAWQDLERRLGETMFGDALRESLSGLAPEASMVMAGVGTALSSIGNAIAGALLVFVGGIYLAAQPRLYRTGILKLIPAARRALAEQSLAETGRALRLWLLGQLLAMAIVGVVTSVGLALIGLPSALALGVLAGLSDFVPVVGPIVAAIPALLIAFSQGDDTALWTLALYVGVQQLEGNVLMPLIQQRVVSLPPALTMFAIFAAGALFGVAGVLLAAPLTVAAYVLVKRLYVREALDTPTPIPGESQRG
jgi:predicted PurR-regulated permease PerM